MRTFDPKEGDISFYLILFERQALRVHIKEEDWITPKKSLDESVNTEKEEQEPTITEYDDVAAVAEWYRYRTVACFVTGACPRFSTPYHPEGNGLIERWNQTLKNMLHHIIREEGRSWHRHIPFLLWAYREVPNATTGTPPFLLMYGRDPKGPFRRSSVLIPDSTNTLYARWTGPVKVVKRVKPNSFYLQMTGGNLRLLHVNKIREYRARVQTVGVIYDIDDEFCEIYETPTVPAAEKNDEALDRVTLDYLSKKQQIQLKDLLHRHRTLFSGKIKELNLVNM
ncbi:retrovirus-related Pol polyprotein from transposon 17.6 [Trichonephila clavipes]|nr:retrovirus-related Pol polyprotein from transposon 17.6 [Trichonephila clavipes]